MPQNSTRSTKALRAHLVCLVLFCVFVSVSAASAEASTLYGKVIEVNSGDVITIFNLNRPVRVKLLGVDAPELNQAFGDVAKKHLSDLVFDKGVLVQYSGIAADKSLTGRVLLNDADIGAQMIRDGAAWLDANNADRLSATDREVYQQSELAARSEHRGLWQEANPTAPWEFVKAERLRLQTVAPVKTNEPSPSTSVKRSNPGSELTNISLMAVNVKAPASQPASASALPNDFQVLGSELPAGLPFIASPPRDGSLISKTTLFGGQVVKAKAYVAVENFNAYSITWYTAPTFGEDDKTAMDQLIFNELTAALALTGGDPEARCKPQSEKDISIGGYWGRDVDLTQCQVATRLRVFTKVTDDGREVYIAMVGINKPDANVTRFLKTFTMRATPPKK